MALETLMLTTLAELAAFHDQWDRLAVEAGRPFCAPAWGLPWWEHVAPPDALLRAVVVLEGGELVGIAPMYVERWGVGIHRYSFVGGRNASRVEPLASPGRIEEVAVALAAALAQARPRPDLLRLESVPSDSPWLDGLNRSWPGRRRPLRVLEAPWPTPGVTLDAADLDDWLGHKSANFRRQMRKGRRKLESEGARFHVRTPSTDEVAEVVQMHRDRHESSRAGAWMVPEGTEQALAEATAELAADSRIRLSKIEIGDHTVASVLLFAAGDGVSYWLAGWDPAWAHVHPAMLALVGAIEDGIRRGEARLDLGPGIQQYKRRLSDYREPLETVFLLPPSPRRPIVRAQLLGRRAKNALLVKLGLSWKVGPEDEVVPVARCSPDRRSGCAPP